jgi:hypothetical protein
VSSLKRQPAFAVVIARMIEFDVFPQLVYGALSPQCSVEELAIASKPPII